MNNTRVPFAWDDPDVRATAGPRVGERFSVHVEVDEGRWRNDRFAAEVLQQAIRTAVQRILHEKYDLLVSVVTKALLDRTAIEAIVHEEVRRVARACAEDMFQAPLPSPASPPQEEP